MYSPARKKDLLASAAVLVAVLSATVMINTFGWFNAYERQFTDFFHNLAGTRFQAQQVLLVSIDDRTLQNHRDEPLVFWGPHYGRVIERLRTAGAKVIGIDVRFMISAETWLQGLGVDWDSSSRTYDSGFRQQLASGQVILVGSLNETEDEGVELVLPVDDYRYSLPRLDADIGLDALYPDDDGVVRSFVPSWFPDGPPPRLTLAARLVLAAQSQDPLGDSWKVGSYSMPNRPQAQRISFCGPPGTIPSMSFDRLLAEDELNRQERSAIAGKVVIIGMDYANAQDVHSTPYTSGWFGQVGQLMGGPEIHANIVETLLADRIPNSVPTWLTILIQLLLVACGAWLFFRTGPFQAALAGLALAVIVTSAAYFLFSQNYFLPIRGVHLALLLCYLGSIGLRLTGEERSRQQIHKLFGRYVSDEVVDLLVRAESQPVLGGQQRPVSVLFSDIRNFTTISEKLEPPEVVEMLNTYFSLVTDAILAEGGTIDKFIGDAVMAVFGSPVHQQDHARRALRAAEQMSTIADGFRDWMAKRFAQYDLPQFDVGIGIHSGQAVIGNIGSSRRMEFTAIGDTVNTASRLEGVTKQLAVRIIVSASTVAEAGEKLRLGREETLPVKGRTEQVHIFEFLGFEKE